MTPKQRMLASARPCGGNGPSRRSKRLAANSTGMAGYCTSTSTASAGSIEASTIFNEIAGCSGTTGYSMPCGPSP